MKDKDAGLNIKKGCQEVDGATALAYSRSRHAQTLGDLDRVQHQREVIAAIGSEVLSPWTVVNPVTYWQLNMALPDFFVFGDGMNPFEAVSWALAMSRVGSSGMMCTVPLTDGSATSLDEELAQGLFTAIINDDTSSITTAECTASGLEIAG
jgi:hypothetical protein